MNAAASQNIWYMDVTLVVSQLSMFWSKLDACENVPSMFTTWDTSQVASDWLKAEAPQNMDSRVVALDTSQESKGWLKAEKAKTLRKDEMRETSQPLMSWSKSLYMNISLIEGVPSCQEFSGELYAEA